VSSPLCVHVISADDEFSDRLKSRQAGQMEIRVFRSSAACLDALGRNTPDALLIDLSMPGDEGFEFHRRLRDDFEFSDIYQLLVCPLDALGREGLAPDDVLMHPAPEALMDLKLGMLMKHFEARGNTRSQLEYAQNVAFTSMSAMGELGVVMQFLTKSFDCHNVQSVARLAVEGLTQYELTGAVYLVWEGDHHVRTTHGGPLPADQMSLVLRNRGKGRVLESGGHLLVNFDHVTVLLTDVPTDDPARLGRIRDNIATLAEGIESRVAGLLMENDNLLKQQGIRYAVTEIRDSVIDLDVRQTNDQLQTAALINGVIDDFEQAFHHMALHVEHENILIADLLDLRQRIAEIVGTPKEVHEKLMQVVSALQTLAGEIES